MPAATGGALTRADIEAWDITHLEAAATHWSSTAAHWESHFETIHTGMLRPGGTTWEGTAADAAAERSWADLVKVRGAGDALYAAASRATNGAGDIAWAKRQVLDAINEAEEAGFTVGQDFSVTDKSAGGLIRSTAARQQQAQAFATEISTRVQALAAIDKQVATQITTALAPLRTIGFNEPTVQAVDYHRFKQDPLTGDPTAPNPNFPGRDARGRFTDGNTGSADGAAAAEERIKQAERETGETFVRQQIRAAVIDPKTGQPMVDPRDKTPIYRYYDALQPTSDPGKFIGIEVKSGDADLTRRQGIFDGWVRSGLPATGDLNGKPVEIIDTEKLQAPRFVPPPPPEAPAAAPRAEVPAEPPPAAAPRAPPPAPRGSGGGGFVGGGGIVLMRPDLTGGPIE